MLVREGGAGAEPRGSLVGAAEGEEEAHGVGDQDPS